MPPAAVGAAAGATTHYPPPPATPLDAPCSTNSYILAPSLVQPKLAGKASALMALSHQVGGGGPWAAGRGPGWGLSSAQGSSAGAPHKTGGCPRCCAGYGGGAWLT